MSREIDLTVDERAALDRFRTDIAELPTGKLLVALPLLESSAPLGAAPRCLFAVLASYLCGRLHLDRTFVLAHPDGVTAGIAEQHATRQAALALLS